MTYNNTVTLIGNTGDEARLIKTDNNSFATLSLATTDSYKDKEGNWQNKETIWHRVLIFKPSLIEEVQAYPKGVRLKITGSISYREFQVPEDDGGSITKREAAIVAGKIEEAALVKKNVA